MFSVRGMVLDGALIQPSKKSGACVREIFLGGGREGVDRDRRALDAEALVWCNRSSRYKFFRPCRGGAALDLISGGSVPQERDCTPG